MKQFIQKVLSGISLSIPRQESTGRDERIDQDLTEAIYASCTGTRKALNRDACSSFCNPPLAINGIVVADGIGTGPLIEEASQFAVNYVATIVEHLKTIESLDLEKIFDGCRHELDKVFAEKIRSNQFGTTLIVALMFIKEGKRKIRIAYTGNGAAWHIKGNFDHFESPQHVPWNAVNYLNPHSVQQEGREVLYNSISLKDSGNYSGPTVIDLNCENEFGDMVMICTDGIYSYDQVNSTEDGFGDIWLPFGVRMKLFFHQLENYFHLMTPSKESLLFMLEKYMAILKEKELIDDDASIAVLISPQSINYQQKMRACQKRYG